MDLAFNPQEVGKGIADFGFLIIAGSAYLIYSATLFYFFVKWFVRIINHIIDKQMDLLEEILSLEKQQLEKLNKIEQNIEKAA